MKVTLISGSPSEPSSTDAVLKFVEKELQAKGIETVMITPDMVPSEDLTSGNYMSPAVHKITEEIKASAGLVVASPVYKAAYTGVLKSLLDLIPQGAFKYKHILPIMTGGTPAHLLALEYSLKPLLAQLEGLNLKGVYVLSEQIDEAKLEAIIDESVENRLLKQLEYFTELIH